MAFDTLVNIEKSSFAPKNMFHPHDLRSDLYLNINSNFTYWILTWLISNKIFLAKHFGGWFPPNPNFVLEFGKYNELARFVFQKPCRILRGDFNKYLIFQFSIMCWFFVVNDIPIKDKIWKTSKFKCSPIHPSKYNFLSNPSAPNQLVKVAIYFSSWALCYQYRTF